MGQCFLYGNGGGGLRLRTFGGTSAPSNPRDNDIWIKTDIAIAAWELSDKTFPSWEMPSGFVYIKGDFAGSYDYRETTGLALDVPGNHDGIIYAGLTNCVQYDGSAWASKDAYVYHDGWHQFSYTWNGELFDNGNQYTTITGGWTLSKFSVTDGAFDTGLTSQTSGNDVMACSVNKVDVTRFSTLHISCYSNYSNSGGRGTARFGLCSTNGLSNGDFAAYRDIDTGSSTITEYSVDVSSITGSYYVKFYANVNFMQGWLKITKMWLT